MQGETVQAVHSEQPLVTRVTASCLQVPHALHVQDVQRTQTVRHLQAMRLPQDTPVLHVVHVMQIMQHLQVLLLPQLMLQDMHAACIIHHCVVHGEQPTQYLTALVVYAIGQGRQYLSFCLVLRTVQLSYVQL